MFYYYMFIVKPQFQQKIQKYSTLEFSAFPFSICRLRQAVRCLECAVNTTGGTMLLKLFEAVLIYGWASAEPPAACQLP